ncbi:hypothetical protein IAI37_11545 [Streptococcus pseudopneumoniae]|nr:fibronectin-binding SSURE repeat-containing protein [Streptococcus pseudopneumoniae]MBF9607227.1 hypothetical protein [Streptococcus pseudopneumoniae]
MTARSDVKSAVKNNIKDSIDVPAAYLEQAKGEGPFTAGVNLSLILILCYPRAYPSRPRCTPSHSAP